MRLNDVPATMVALSTASHLKPLYVSYFTNGQFREEEPLKGYRQWVFDNLVMTAKKNGVI